MNNIVDLEAYKAQKEFDHLHEISPHVELVDGEGKVIGYLYEPGSPMDLNLRKHIPHQQLQGTITAYEPPPTWWDRLVSFTKRLFKGGQND